MAFRPKTPEPPAAALTAVEIKTQIADLVADKARLIRTIEGIPAREAELLDRDASDAEFATVDTARKRAHYQLERLGAQHHQLADQLHAAEEVEQLACWLEYVARYEAQTAEAREMCDALHDKLTAILDLTNEAARAGFSQFAGPRYLPFYAPHPAFATTVHAMANGASALRLIQAVRPPKLYTIRFTEWTILDRGPASTAYMMGQTAGFDGPTAWAFVLAQRAEWANLADIPPKPKPKRRPPGQPRSAQPEPNPRADTLNP